MLFYGYCIILKYLILSFNILEEIFERIIECLFFWFILYMVGILVKFSK